MTELHLTCPHCGAQIELQLEENPRAVLFRCQKCGAGLLHAMGQTVEMDGMEFPDFCAKKMQRTRAKARIRPPRANSGHSDKPPINADDIIDLHLLLEQTQDFDDFLAKL